MKKYLICLIVFGVSFFGVKNVVAKTIDSSQFIQNSLVWKYFDDGVTINDNYCSNSDFKKPFIFLGRIFSIVKILIPILIIAFGIIDFFKAMIASKDDEIKKSSRSLMLRVIAGVIIFFIPTIVHLVFLLIDDWSNYETDYSQCSLCITSPGKC